MPAPDQVRPDRYVRRRLPRWAVVVLVLLAVLLLALLAAVGLFVWAFSGGWDGLRPHAEPTDRQVATARAGARDHLSGVTTAALHSVQSGVPATELARVRFDQCEHGQNNWKIHDGYTLRCELSDSVVVSAVEGDVTTVAGRLDAALRRDGWVPVGVRDEMTQDAAGGGQSYLLATRTGRYQRGADEDLTVGVTVRGPSPVSGDLPYDPSVTVEGDVDAYQRAVQGSGGTRPGTTGGAPVPRVVVHTSVRYFEDD